jgi:hypothetical protein
MPPGGRARQRQFSFFKLAAAVSVAVVGFVLLLGGLSQAGLFAAPSLPRAGVPAATFAPTATALPTPTPTIPPNWLRVTPTSIELTCKGKTSKQSLTIRNQGNDSLDWLIEANGFTGLNFSQAYGTIPAGKQTTITVTDANWTWSDINNRFAVAPQDDNAGDPAMVSYTAKGCFFGGEGSHG